MSKHFICAIEQVAEEGIYPFEVADKSLLLVRHNGLLYLIENKCGHFGVPLATGRVEQRQIICSEHGISFDLVTGCVVNRPYENCDAIKTYKLDIEDKKVWVDL